MGALDPDRFPFGSTRKGGGKGGGYFVELEDEKGPGSGRTLPANGSGKRTAEWSSSMISTSLQSRNVSSAHADLRVIPISSHSKQTKDGSHAKSIYKDSDNDEPAHLFMYQQFAMTAQPSSKLSPARRLSPSDEVFYPTVAVQALMRILKDSSLSNLHGMVMKVSGTDALFNCACNSSSYIFFAHA